MQNIEAYPSAVPSVLSTLSRAHELFGYRLKEISRDADRRFGFLTVLEWIASIAAAIWIFPDTLAGQYSWED